MWSHHFMEKSWEKGGIVTDFIFLDSKITADGDCSHEIKRCLLLGRKAMTNQDSILKRRDFTLLANVHIVKAMVFPGVVCMWELDYTEGWVLKNWCFWIVVLEKTLESSLKCKEIKLVNPKWNQSWIFTGRTDDEAEIPRIWPPVVKNWLVRKNSDAGKDWRKEEKGMTECEMVAWHRWFNEHEFEQTLGGSEGQGSLACCSPWGHKELDMIESLNNNTDKKT